MGRKPIEDFQVKRIILLRSEGASISQIMKDTGLSRGTIQNYIEMHKKDIEKMKNKPQDINELSKPNSDKNNTKPSKKEKKQEFVSVEDETVKGTIRKTADSVSALKAKEITEDYKGAQMLHSASVRYQKNIEMMGLEWDRFIAWAIDEAYERAVEAYKEKMEQQLREASLLQEAIEEELGNPKPKTEDGMLIEEGEE